MHARPNRRATLLIAGLLASSALPVMPAEAQLLSVLTGKTSAASGKPITPYYGNISPFYGNISQFYGNISPFYGNISPFYGNISPFWANISPFWGNTSPFYGNISPLWGNISPFGGSVPAGTTDPRWDEMGKFWTDVGNRWGALASRWAQAGATPGAAELDGYAADLRGIVDSSAGFWGSTVQAKTGKDFATGFAAPLLARYGMDLSDSRSLAGLTAEKRAQFFLEWYDGLMNLSGTDRVDHWMRTVRWSPALSQTQGSGGDSVIGLLDFTVKDPTLAKSVQVLKGTSTYANGHGDMVASLMIAPQDGQGVMGIAPRASVIGYNPFDSTGTASWDDVKAGVQMLVRSRASIINMSLGVPGWTFNPEWNKVFSDFRTLLPSQNNIFVIAAGNDGLTQTTNVEWNSLNAPFILVGSIDPNEQISGFSNRPGEACLTTLGLCSSANKLKNRFIVAPGELLLVTDENGGTTRMSGTSFAAPLVSATIALLHDRWPWLAKYPKVSADIVLKSARDLGDPGIDATYGVGVLDVEASQSPLSFDAVKWYTLSGDTLKEQSIGSLKSDPKTVAKWEADGAYFYVYETLDNTFRDFTVPLSSKLIGKTALSAGGQQQQFQQYLYSKFINWVGSSKSGTSTKGFVGFSGYAAPVANPYGLDLQMRIAPRQRLAGYRQSTMPYQTALAINDPDGRLGFTLGSGDGAVELGGARAFGMAADYDGDTGGVNPVLGMASGGAFATASYGFGERLRVSMGVTERHLRRDLQDGGIAQQALLGGIRDNDTAAQHVTVTWAASPALSLNAAYTHLAEAAALLGVQSVDRADLAGGTQTSGVTMGADLALPRGFRLAASGTMARTSGGGTISAAAGGLVSSSFQVALDKAGVVDGADRLRLTFSQPMFVERGQIAFTGVQVIDRAEGTLSSVTQTFDISGTRRSLVAEALYARPILAGTGEIGLFGRARVQRGLTADTLPSYIGGAQLKMGF